MAEPRIHGGRRLPQRCRLSDQPRRAWPHLRAAAHLAGRALAIAEAIRLCNQALDLDPDDLALRFSFLDLRQRAYQFLGQTESEGRDADAMQALAAQTSESRMRAMVCERLALFYVRRGDTARAKVAIEAAVEAARQAGVSLLQIKTVVLMAMLMRDSVAGQARAMDPLTYALEQAQASGNPVDEAYVLGHIGVVQGEQGRLDEAAHMLERGLAMLRAAGNVTYPTNLLHSLAGVYGELGQVDRAQGALDEAIAASQRASLTGIQLPLLLGLGKLHMERGDASQARAHFEAALKLAAEFQRPMLAAEAELGLGQAAVLAGAHAEAVARLTPVVERLAGKNRRLWAHASAALAAGLLGQGSPAEASVHSAAATAWARETESQPNVAGLILVSHAQVLAAAGQAAEAVRAHGWSLAQQQAEMLSSERRPAYLQRPCVRALLEPGAEPASPVPDGDAASAPSPRVP